MDADFILKQLFVLLQSILPPLIVTWVTSLVKKWKENLTPFQITTYIVPVISVVVAVIEYYLVGANFIWAFILGLAGIAVYEIKKNFVEK